MKNPPRLPLALAYLAVLYSLVLSVMAWYEVHVKNELLSALIYMPIGVAGVTVISIMSIMKPENLRLQHEWPQFLWALPATCMILGVGGYAIMWWLYGNSLTPLVEIVNWSFFAFCMVFGPLIAWLRGRTVQ